MYIFNLYIFQFNKNHFIYQKGLASILRISKTTSDALGLILFPFSLAGYNCVQRSQPTALFG